jgi:hypothetical protein
MLSDLGKEFSVIVFFNTSLDEKDEGTFFDIYEELYKYAKDLKAKQTTSRQLSGLAIWRAEGITIGFSNSNRLWLGQKYFNLAFCCYLYLQFFNRQRFRAQ